MGDLKVFLDKFMMKKCIDALVKLAIIFYVRCLLMKAQKHRLTKNKSSYFRNNAVALARIARDIQVMHDYFDGLSEDDPALNRVIENEFFVLVTIIELLQIAATGVIHNDAGSCTGFIVVLHKRIKVYKNTKRVVRDLWRLIQPKQEKLVKRLVESIKEPLNEMYPNHDETLPAPHDRMTVPGLQFEQIIFGLYVGYKKNKTLRTSLWRNRNSTSGSQQKRSKYL